MEFWMVVFGFTLILIGFSIWYDDREFNRLAELELLEQESSPELYNSEEDDAFHDRWGSLAPVVAWTVVGFYALRGILTAVGGGWLVLLGVG